MKKNAKVILILCATLLGLAAFVIVPIIGPRRISITETLHPPILAVNGWNADSLLLADGRRIQLSGFRSLPAQSAALAESVKRGVEINSDGRVYALVRAHSTCGNDRVREHIHRVDLANWLAFLRVGEPIHPTQREITSKDVGGQYPENGWSNWEFMMFENSEKQEAIEGKFGEAKKP